ncbi:peptidylprolyl isomerase [Montanilutibacter psychrotolerans]|uniref:Chaperone SurA n=1 Tax=Montanilutibacter psychrotolerans TaxID=1327343 RepID=A0A3M8SS43_9GAMM|nr:peptidylprolyl isomerase [Lysobacter psychrotolerans]RNF84171.1 molecular chaperone SurA [Lysobacter psychrotolerans]
MKKLLACLLAGALFAASVHAQQLQAIDSIAAVVDEDVVLRSELDRAVNNILAQYAGRNDQLPPRAILERQVLERLVLVKLQAARAASTGVRVTDQEVDQSIAGIAQQNRVGVDQLREQLARDGTSFEDFRGSIRDELLSQRLRQRFAQTRIAISDAEVDAAVAAQANAGAQYHLAHILVALPEGVTADQIALGQKKIDGIKALLDKGEMDFNAAAVRYSDSPNALEGGDLGWRSLDEIPAAFAQIMRNLKPGEVTAPLRGPSGFQLLKLVEVRDASQAGPSLVTQYHARHILVRVTPTMTDAQAKAKADTARARIAGGADFAEVAKQESEDLNSQSRGGELGWFGLDDFGADFGTVVANLRDGEVSQPIRTPVGWHVIERLGSRQQDVGSDNRRAQVREQIGRRKLEEEWNRYLLELRGEAYVEVRGADGAPVTDAASDASGG